MASILSFDSRSMAILLSEKFDAHFSDEFPIFYLNKILKRGSKDQYFYRTAIDRSLKANQVRAVSLMIQYIVRYQNNYTASYLFLKNIPILLEKGIKLKELFESNVFTKTFDYDDWPGSHPNNETYIRPYNDSLFQIRYSYKKVFHEEEFRSMDEVAQEEEDHHHQKIDNSKIYKIKYSVNLLPLIGEYIVKTEEGMQFYNTDVAFMQMLNQSDELEVYSTDTI